MSFPWLLSFAVGFLSLSQEVLWVRLVGFVQGGTPLAFSFVLASYLLGIALGAAVGRGICRKEANLYRSAAIVLFLAAATDPLPPLLGPYISNQSGAPFWFQVALPLSAIVAAAAIKSVLFPIAHHLGSEQSGPRVGSSVSRIYFGNILGSTLGPIVTGFVLLDVLPLDACFSLIGLASMGLALACATKAGSFPLGRAALASALVACLALLPLLGPGFVRSTGDRWYSNEGKVTQAGEISKVIENRQGIVHTVSRSPRNDDVIYGGNMFDGRINVDLRHDTNGIARVFLLAGLHAAPRRVLVIGASAGAWTRALGSFPLIEHIDAVEINPAYLKLIESYEEISPILADPRIQFHIDDGRRWLKRHPQSMFDLIVINNTHHFRAYSTNLLSREFLLEAKAHLRPGGILTLNSTGSLDVARTAAEVFPDSFRHAAFVYASDHDPRPSKEIARVRLEALRMDGRPVLEEGDFIPGGAGARVVDMAVSLKPLSESLGRDGTASRVITDANLLPEYRHGKRLDFAPFAWMLPERKLRSIGDAADGR